MNWLYYTGFRPTSHYHGLAWLGRTNVALIGVEIAPDAIGFVFLNVWIGVVYEE